MAGLSAAARAPPMARASSSSRRAGDRRLGRCTRVSSGPPRPSTSCARSTPTAIPRSRRWSSSATPKRWTGSARSDVHVGRAGDRAGIRPRLRRPTWRTTCWRASGSCASGASCWSTPQRSGCCSRTARSSAPRSGPRRRASATIRARSTLLATGGFGGDPDAARGAHPSARARPSAAREHAQRRRRPSARPVRRAPRSARRTPASTGT